MQRTVHRATKRPRLLPLPASPADDPSADGPAVAPELAGCNQRSRAVRARPPPPAAARSVGPPCALEHSPSLREKGTREARRHGGHESLVHGRARLCARAGPGREGRQRRGCTLVSKLLPTGRGRAGAPQGSVTIESVRTKRCAAFMVRKGCPLDIDDDEQKPKAKETR